MSRSSRAPARLISSKAQTKQPYLPSMSVDDDDDSEVDLGIKLNYRNSLKAQPLNVDEDEEDNDFQASRNLRRGVRTPPSHPIKAKQTMPATSKEISRTKEEIEIEEIDKKLAQFDALVINTGKKEIDKHENGSNFHSSASDSVDDGESRVEASIASPIKGLNASSSSSKSFSNISGGRIDWPTRFRAYFKRCESKSKKSTAENAISENNVKQQNIQAIFENDTLDEVRDLIFCCMQSTSTEPPDMAVQRVLESQAFHRLRMSRGALNTENRPSHKIVPPRLPQVGANNFINALLFLDHQRLVIGGGDGSIQIYDVLNNTCSMILTEHKGSVNDIKLLVDGNICSCSNDHTIKIWNPVDGRCIRTFEGHTNWVLCLAVTEKHKIVSGSYDNTIRVWVMKGECIKTLYGHAEAIYSLCILATGVLISGSVDTTIKLWDLEKGDVIETLEEHKESVMSLCALSEKDQFASGSLDNSIRIWSVAPSSTLYVCTKILRGHEGSVRNLLELPDSGRLVSASDDDSIRVWDYNSEVCQKVLSIHKNRVRALVRDPDSPVSIVSGGGDRTICFTNIDKFDNWT